VPAPSIRTQAARIATPLPHGDPLSAFAVADPAHLWIVADRTLLATTDGGRHWNPQYQGAITNLAFVDAQRGWLTAYDTLLATTDGGQTWTPQYQAWPMDLLNFVTPRDGWIVVGSSLLTTHNGGQTWQTLPSEAPGRVRAFLDARHGWGFSQESNGVAPPKLAWTGDGGRTWQARAVPGCRWSKGGGQFSASGATTAWLVCAQDPGAGTPVGVNQTTDSGRTWVSFPAQGALGAWLSDIPQSLFFLDNQHGWLGAPVGTLEGLTWGYLLQATTDGGYTWQPRVLLGSGSPAAANSGLLDYRFLSPTRGYARIVYDSFRNGSLLMTQDGGAHWSALSGQPSGPNGPFRFLDARQGLGIGLPWDSGAVLATNDGGQSWQPIGTLTDSCRPAVLVGVRDLSFLDHGHGWAVADCFEQYQQRQILVHTTDGGATWHQQQAQAVHSWDPHWRTISFLDERSGYLAGDANFDLVAQSHGRVGGTGARSNDGGATFHLAFTATRSVAEIRFVSTAVGWMRADGQIYATVDSGGSWRPLGLDAVQAIDLHANGQGWALVIPPDSQGSAILATADGGQTWVRYTFASLRPSAFSFADTEHGWLRDEQNQFYATTDGGASWAPVP
jgi:photosystem II stability/assembly factor-like uncharacterized protein